MIEYQPIFRSPITVSPAPAKVVSELRVSDLTGVPVVLVQGQADGVLKQHWSTLPAKPGQVVEAGEVLVARLTPEEVCIFGKSAGATVLSAADLASAFALDQAFAHATDFAHGRAVVKLIGPAAGEALCKICGLDFHDTAFPNLHVKQTSAAKIKTLIARCDESGTPVYYLHVDRPLGQYFWEILLDAGQEFGIAAEE